MEISVYENGQFSATSSMHEKCSRVKQPFTDIEKRFDHSIAVRMIFITL